MPNKLEVLMSYEDKEEARKKARLLGFKDRSDMVRFLVSNVEELMKLYHDNLKNIDNSKKQ